MDRRKLKSRTVLHKQLHSSASQTVVKTVVDNINPLIRSASVAESSLLNSRKRKNSEDGENEAMDIDDDSGDEVTLSSRLPSSSVNARKKRKNVIDDDVDEDEQPVSPKKSAPTAKRDWFAKPKATQETGKATRKSNNSDKDEEDDKSESGGSYIKGVLEALDKSPSKLSQSSNSSVDKYRKVNLRTPMRSKLQRPVSKAIAEKRNQKANTSQKPEKSLNSPKPTISNVRKKPGKKSVLKKKVDSDESMDSDVHISDDDEEISIPVVGTLAKKSIKKATDKSSQKPDKSQKPSTTKDSPLKVQATPEKNKRIVESPEIELSPLKNFGSPEKNNVNTRRKKTSNQTDDKLENFLDTVGITLCSGEESHIASNDHREVIQKMKDLLNSDTYDSHDIITSWTDYIEDEDNLKKSLLEMRIESDEGVAVCSKAISLSRILMQVPQLQVQILSSMFRKLISAVITTESSDDVPWALQMLQQFRFLEVLVDPDLFISRIEELLSSSPEWFQREIIIFIPDIVTDTQHRTTAEMLTKIMENNSDLTNIILDCIHNLILGKEYREELREQILGLLEEDCDKSTVPAITRFVLTSCSTEAVALKSLNALRLIDMAPTKKEKVDEIYTNQVFMVNAIKTNIQLFKEVAQAAAAMIKTTAEAVPLDIIISILLYQTTSAKKKVVESNFYSHIKDGYYKTSLLNMFYSGYKQVAKSFQSTSLNLAIHLLKADSPTHVEFAIEWLRNMFISQSDTSYKQREIMEKLLNLMGSKDKTVKNALEVLCRMANEDSERKILQQHAGFLRGFLDKIDNLQFDEVATLYHLFHGLCTQSEHIANILNDDLAIIMQKQLCSSKVVTKCKGVIGAIMAIKHLAGSSETSEDAYHLLKKTLNSLKGCIRSQALFYDQLGQVIASTNNINEEFLSNITTYFEEIFVNTCLVEENPGVLVPQFGLNDSSMAESYYVNFESGKAGAIVPVFFKLLRICNLRLSGSLESINAVLGCPILMPDDLDMPEPSTADYMIHCINWFRELIGGFVTQEEKLLREQVLKRLDKLMALQGEFVSMVAMCESRYQPPPCYFHHFPAPQFVRVDMKVGKKGGRKGRKPKDKAEKEDKKEDKNESTLSKSIVLPEWENWEIGSEMTVKNPEFFRQMDTKIIHLLDANMDIHSSQLSSENVTIAQVCFIVKELLGMFENQSSESFMRDLIHLLPKICAKLQKIIADLREHDSAHEKEAAKLLLCLLITIFSWKEFQSARYNTLLREGLRTLASMMSQSSALLRSCKDLVAEAYKYFESLADVATHISLAVALVDICGCLMKHSNSFTEQSKERQARMAYGYLCLEWSSESHGPQYRNAVKQLLKTWVENEPDPLKTVSSVMKWLPEQAASLERPQSRLSRIPSVTRAIFPLLLKQLFAGLIKGIEVSLASSERDPERIRVWLEAATCLDKMSDICKSNTNAMYLILFLRYISILYQMVLNNGMKLLEANVKYQTEEVLNVIKLFQSKCLKIVVSQDTDFVKNNFNFTYIRSDNFINSTSFTPIISHIITFYRSKNYFVQGSGRFLRDIFCTARKEKNVSLLKLIPIAKSRRERFIYRVKGMLTANNSIGAFWMGNLLNKGLDGEEIASESSEDITVGSEITTENNVADDEGSEIFPSDSDEDIDVGEEN